MGLEVQSRPKAGRWPDRARQRPAGGQRWPDWARQVVSARPEASAGRNAGLGTYHVVPGRRPALAGLGTQCPAKGRRWACSAKPAEGRRWPFPCQTGHAVPGRPKAGMVPWLSPLITVQVQVDLIILAKFWRLRPVFSHIFEKGARGSKPLPHRCVAHPRGVRSAARTLPPPALRSPPPPPPQPATSRKPFHTLTPPPLPPP